MTIDELIDLTKKSTVTPEAIEAFKQRQKEREAEYEKYERSQRETTEWLNRPYF